MTYLLLSIESLALTLNIKRVTSNIIREVFKLILITRQLVVYCFAHPKDSDSLTLLCDLQFFTVEQVLPLEARWNLLSLTDDLQYREAPILAQLHGLFDVCWLVLSFLTTYQTCCKQKRSRERPDWATKQRKGRRHSSETKWLKNGVTLLQVEYDGNWGGFATLTSYNTAI